MFFLPDSPRWLAQQGREEEAFDALKRVHGSATNAAAVRIEMDEISAQINWERENVSNNFLDLFRTRPSLHRTLAAVVLQICCQWTGINVAGYFGPEIYANLGFSGNTILLIGAVTGIWGLIVNIFFVTCMADQIGRRKPLIYGGIGMAICLAWQAGISSLFTKPGYSNSSAGIAGDCLLINCLSAYRANASSSERQVLFLSFCTAPCLECPTAQFHGYTNRRYLPCLFVQWALRWQLARTVSDVLGLVVVWSLFNGDILYRGYERIDQSDHTNRLEHARLQSEQQWPSTQETPVADAQTRTHVLVLLHLHRHQRWK
jgi:hypothetical protein